MTAKQPITRPGQRKAYAKGTRQQIDQRVHSAALLLFCGLTKSEIHQVFRGFYGVEWRQSDRYMAIARTREGSKALDFPLASRIKLLQHLLIRNDLRI